MLKRTATTVLTFAAFVAAAAFFWGTLEAVSNHYWRPNGTWWGERLLESAFARAAFYAVVVAAAALAAAGVAFLARRLRRKKAARPSRGWRGAVAAAAILASNAGWFVAGHFANGKLKLASWRMDLREPALFLRYWSFWAAVAAAAAVVLALALGRRRWWRAAGRWARALGAAAFAALVVIHLAAPAFRPKARGPNIIFIVLDAWRADAFRPEVMPNLTRYAASHAVVYPRTWSCAPWTLPSMAANFTGLYPDAYKINLQPKRGLAPTVAQLLRDGGYDTAAFVGNTVLERYTPLTTGFEYYVFWDNVPALRAVRFYQTNWYNPAVRARLKLHRRYGPETSRRLTALARDYVGAPHRRPYFMWLHYMDPHAPYTPPPGFYQPGDEYYVDNFRDGTPDRAVVNHRLYEGECAFVDSLLPQVLDRVAGDPNTVVIVTSDHGEEFWEHYTYGHGKSVYDTAVRVPLVVSVPGTPAAVAYRATSMIDLAPTILTLAGLDVPKHMVGQPTLGRVVGGPERLVFVGSEYTDRRDYRPARHDAVILWPWKLIAEHRRMKSGGEYFNLESNPGESVPLPEDARAGNLLENLLRWKRDVTPKKGGASPTEAVDAADLKALGYVK